MNPKKILAKNLQKHLERKGITQTKLANDLNFPEMTVSNWMNEKTYPRVDRLQQMADYFGVMRSDLTEIKEETTPYATSAEYKYFPAYVSAGLPNDVEAVTDYDTISISNEIMGKYANSKDIYFIKINGESMNKIIPHDSLIAVRPVSSIHDLKTGDIVVYRKDGEYAVKRLVIDEDKWIFKPESTDDRFYDDVIYKDADVKIKGKVVLYIVEV